MKTVTATLILLLTSLPSILPAQPRIEVEPEQFEIDVGDGEIQNLELTIRNTGDELLRWQGELEIISEPEGAAPGRDDAGDLIAEFNIGRRYSLIGWDADGERMWFRNDSTNQYEAYSHNNYEDVRQVAQLRVNPGAIVDVCYGDGVIYLINFGSRQITRITDAGQNIGAILLPFSPMGLAVDSRNQLLFLLNANHNIHVLQMQGWDEIGVIDNHLQFHGNRRTSTFEWVSSHSDGQLWFNDFEATDLCQVAVDTENWEATGAGIDFQGFPDAEAGRSFAHDGRFFWTCDYIPGILRVYDDGINEEGWIGLVPSEGEIEPGGEQIVRVVIDPRGLRGGVYEADVHIFSNDPENGDWVVPFTIIIVGAPDMVVAWPDEAGFPDEINFNRMFGQIEVDEERSIPITFGNEGTENLVVDDITTDDEEFNCVFEAFLLDPNERRVVNIDFHSEAGGLFGSQITIISNDPDEGELQIPLVGFAGPMPAIAVDPMEMEFEPENDTLYAIVNIASEGDGVLIWEAEIEEIDEPERDETSVKFLPDNGELEPGEDQNIAFQFALVEWDRREDRFIFRIASNDPLHLTTEIPITIFWPNEINRTLEVPSEFSLAGIYPNPFNARTTVLFTMPFAGEARLAVFDLKGNRVAELAGGRFAAGSHRIDFDGAGLAAGVYLIHLQGGGEVRTAKALILK